VIVPHIRCDVCGTEATGPARIDAAALRAELESVGWSGDGRSADVCDRCRDRRIGHEMDDGRRGAMEGIGRARRALAAAREGAAGMGMLYPDLDWWDGESGRG
jgi:hypothetical protein